MDDDPPFRKFVEDVCANWRKNPVAENDVPDLSIHTVKALRGQAGKANKVPEPHTIERWANDLWTNFISTNAVFPAGKFRNDQKAGWGKLCGHLRRYCSSHEITTTSGFIRHLLKLAESDRQSVTRAPSTDRAPGKVTASETKGLNLDSLLQPFHAYLRFVAKECAPVVVRGLDLGGDALRDVPRLAHVYAQLETGTARPPEPGAEKPMEAARGNLSALDVIFAPGQRRVVLTGEPGSGKSTLVQYITLCLADRCAGLAGADSLLKGAKVPALLESTVALPFRVILREFAPELDAAKGSEEDVVNFLVAQLRRFRGAAARLEELLAAEDTPAFVLFDGLDEVPREKLPAVRRAICAFAEGDYRHCRIAVTCRTASYEKKEFALPRFPKAHVIAPLSRSLQGAFVYAWYREIEHVRRLPRGEGDACAATLLRAIDSDSSERLKDMAGNPFFLTAMAAMHRPDRRLPDTGAELMDKLVNDILEETRMQRAESDVTAKAAEPELGALRRKHGISVADFRWHLEKLAYDARQTRSDRDSRLIPDDTLTARLHKLSPKLTGDDVSEFKAALLLRAGLLQSCNADTCEFAYRFEEFLAGCHLANRDAWKKKPGQTDHKEFHLRARDLLRVPNNPQARDDYARKVVLWAAGFNVHVQGDRGSVLDLVHLLVKGGNAGTDRNLTDLELAADIARDAAMETWDEERVPGVEAAVSELRASLQQVRDSEEEIKVRAKAASAIGRLGDLRTGVGIFRKAGESPAIPRFAWYGPDPKDAHSPFPAEPFAMGGDRNAYGASREPFSCTRIRQPFFIAKFPVTVEQYQAFVDDHGYEADGDRHWTDAGRLWRDGKADFANWPAYASDYYRTLTFPIRGPENYGPEFQTPNHPRVGVSWYEAVAFCRWLNSEKVKPLLLGDAGVKGDGTFRLAGDAEWELAARWSPGSKKGKAVMRTFPWGTPEKEGSGIAEELTKYCNWYDTGIGHTSAVGLFPTGDAFCGASDMAGNVWEWCRTRWTDLSKKSERDDYNKATDAEDLVNDDAGVVRGGSWGLNIPDLLRAAVRNYSHPGYRGINCGFRVVCCVGESR